METVFRNKMFFVLQEFVSEMNQNDESWIGVVAQWSEKITIKWKWVDGSPVLQQ